MSSGALRPRGWARRGARTPLRRARERAGAAIAAPGIAVLLLITVAPLFGALLLSLTTYDYLSPPRFAGLSNYTSLFSDGAFWMALKNTVYFAVGQVPIGTVAALMVAVLLNRRTKASQGLRTLVYMPHAASYVVVALLWAYLYDPVIGPLNQVLQELGTPTIYFLTDTDLAMPSIIAMSTWRNLGYFMIIILAALQSIPEELYEAAAVDGTNAIQRFFHVTVPTLRPVLAFVLVTWFLGALQMFTQAYVMTGGGPVGATRTLVFEMYEEAFLFLNVGRASAMAVLLFAAVVLVTTAARLFVRARSRDV